MIRAVTHTSDGGILILLGITDGNIERLKSGMPISLNLGELMVEAFKGAGELPRQGLSLAIDYQPTHRQIVEEWSKAGVPLPEDALADAIRIDADQDDGR